MFQPSNMKTIYTWIPSILLAHYWQIQNGRCCEGCVCAGERGRRAFFVSTPVFNVINVCGDSVSTCCYLASASHCLTTSSLQVFCLRVGIWISGCDLKLSRAYVILNSKQHKIQTQQHLTCTDKSDASFPWRLCFYSNCQRLAHVHCWNSRRISTSLGALNLNREGRFLDT